MNYIAEIKAFYDLVQVKQLSQGQIALWHALMYINNKCAWIEWFSVPNIMLEINTGLSRQAIIKARNVLKMYGLIEFKTNGTKATNYRMISMLKSSQDSLQDNGTMSKSLQVGLQVGCQDSLQVGCQDGLQDGCTLNKLNNTKLNETNTVYSSQCLFDFFENNIDMLTPRASEILESYRKDLPDDVIIYAMQKSVDNKQRKISYISGILNNWIKAGVKTLAGAKEEEQQFKKAHSKQPAAEIRDDKWEKLKKKYEQ